jgi:hypothetical protein
MPLSKAIVGFVNHKLAEGLTERSVNSYERMLNKWIKYRPGQVEAGAIDYFTKSVDQNELSMRTASLLKMKEAQDMIKQYNQLLEKQVHERTQKLRQTLVELNTTNLELEQALLNAREPAEVAQVAEPGQIRLPGQFQCLCFCRSSETVV